MMNSPIFPERFQTVWVRPNDIRWKIDWSNPALQELVLQETLRGEQRRGISQKVRRSLITGPDYLRDDDFDLYLSKFSKHPTARRMRKRVIHEQSWRKAGFYDWMEAQIALRGSHDGVHNKRGIRNRYAGFDALIEDARRIGRLRSREELYGEPDESRGIMVGVGRDGKLIFMGRGTHRLAIAQLLELELVPVGICTIHTQATETRLRGRSHHQSLWKNIQAISNAPSVCRKARAGSGSFA